MENIVLSFKGSDGHTYTVERIAPEAFPAIYKPMVPEAWQLTAAGTQGDADEAWQAIFAGCKARKVKLTPVPRPTYIIAREIARNWASGKKGKAGIYFGAVPYIEAMRTMTGTEDYGADDGKGILLYFLANANGYRGALATAHKLELKALAGVK